jgi:hypothetical protein
MRNLLLAATAIAAVALAPGANATLTVTATDFNGTTTTTLIFTPTTVGPGILDGTFADPNFSSFNVSITGFPAIASPNLGTTSLQLSSGTNFDGLTHIIDLNVSQTGLSFPAGAQGTLTQTFNNLIGSPPGGPTTENFLANGAVALTHIFANLPARSDSNTVTSNSLPALTSDGEEFISTFTAAGQQLELTQEFVATQVPEPASLAMLGLGLLGVGFVANRKRSV